MSDMLEQFLNTTEGSSAGISQPQSRTIQYPFLYLTEITDVEVTYLVEAGVLVREPMDESYLQLFLKAGSYKLLGYIKLNFDSVMRLNYLKEHEIVLKVSKELGRSVTSELFDDILLSG